MAMNAARTRRPIPGPSRAGAGHAAVIGARSHGGPDARGHADWDFSTNANACGPSPHAWARVLSAARARYPDPTYQALRERLARFHGVAPARILIAASGSEWIMRWTAWCARGGLRRVWLPPHGYGDYAHAAALWGLRRVHEPRQAQLAWLCDPGSPLGQPEDPAVAAALLADPCRPVALDLAYAPLRLHDDTGLHDTMRERVWQLWSPNKALGLTGVRAAYVVAPLQADAADVAALDAMAPSWPLGADGVALLHAWTDDATQGWLRATLPTLQRWKADLVALLTRRGWRCQPSVTPFVCARPPHPIDAEALRAHGVKLRDAASFGLPGWWRLSAQPPQASAALDAALAAVQAGEGEP